MCILYRWIYSQLKQYESIIRCTESNYELIDVEVKCMELSYFSIIINLNMLMKKYRPFCKKKFCNKLNITECVLIWVLSRSFFLLIWRKKYIENAIHPTPFYFKECFREKLLFNRKNALSDSSELYTYFMYCCQFHL